MNSKLNPLNWNIDNDETDVAQLEIAKQKQYEMDVDFMKCFGTPSGKRVLEWIILHTLDSPTWWPAQTEAFGYFREGQNSLVRQIKAKINNAKEHMDKRK